MCIYHHGIKKLCSVKVSLKPPTGHICCAENHTHLSPQKSSNSSLPP